MFIDSSVLSVDEWFLTAELAYPYSGDVPQRDIQSEAAPMDDCRGRGNRLEEATPRSLPRSRPLFNAGHAYALTAALAPGAGPAV